MRIVLIHNALSKQSRFSKQRQDFCKQCPSCQHPFHMCMVWTIMGSLSVFDLQRPFQVVTLLRSVAKIS
eukprot:4845037-Amphidinium_carterae.1